MAKSLAVLIVEDSESDALLIVRMMTKAGYSISFERVETAEQMRSALKQRVWEMVISDFSMPELDGFASLKILQETGLDIPFIVVSGTMGEDTAVAMMKAGAHDYLMKNKMTRLVPAVERELQQAEERKDRKRLSIENAENEKKFTDLVAQSPDGIFIIDLDGEFLLVNDAICKGLGFSREEFLTLTIQDIIPEQYFTQSKSGIERIVLGKNRGEVTEYILRGKDEKIHFVEVVLAPYYKGKDIIGVQGIARDITSRKQTEQALRESEERFKALIENSSDAITLLDASGKTIYDSPAASGMLGYGPKDWIGRNVFELLHPDDSIRILELYKELVITPGKKVNTAFQVHHKNGYWVWLEMVTTNLLSEASVKAIVLNYHDVTKRKQAEEALSQQNEALIKLNHFSVDLSMLPMKEDIERLISRQIKEICGAELSVFSEYNSTNQTTTTKQIEMNPGIIDKVVQLLGKQVTDVHTVVSDEMYKEMTNQSYGARKTLSEMSFGAISPQVGRAIQALLKVDRFIGIAYLVEGKLYGTSVLGMKKDQPDPAKIIIENYISLAASTLRRKLAEEELIQANQSLSLAQRSSRAGVWGWNIVTDKLEWSPELLELFGLNADTIPTFEKWRSVIYAGDVQAAGDHIDQAIREHKPLSNEYRIVLPSGELLWINVRGDTIYNNKGEPLRMSGICIDITERKRVEQKIQRQFEHLNSLSAIDRVITTNFDLKLSLSEILNHVTKELEVDAADILLLDPISDMLEYAARLGFTSKSVKSTHLRLGESHAGKAALERKLIHIPNLQTETISPLLAEIAAEDDFACYFGVPLINKGKVRGVLEVFHRKPLEPDAEWFEFLNSLAGQAAIAIENSSLYESQQRTYQELTQAYDATIEGWSHAMDLRDKDTEGHTLRVTEITLKLAKAFGLDDEELLQVRWGTLLHDIGKIGVPDGILLKPGPLTDEEWVVMRKHPTFAYEMLSPINYLRRALDIPYSHHEKWDGTGYPQGLKGKQIPLSARIFAVVDVWDALRSDRPYRSAWPDEKVYEHIQTLSGRHFDPQIVEVFLKLPR